MSSETSARVLSQYDLGRAVTAVEAVARSDKPIVEVGCRSAVLGDLEADLQACLEFVGHVDVKFWTRQTSDGEFFRYGFYREPWALQALEFMDQAQGLLETDRTWINGLLFGYSPRAIQEHITRQTERPRPRAASH